jgi:hypothetical protein
MAGCCSWRKVWHWRGWRRSLTRSKGDDRVSPSGVRVLLASGHTAERMIMPSAGRPASGGISQLFSNQLV